MEKFAAKLRKDFPDFAFAEGDVACWSPRQQKVTYSLTGNDQEDTWSLLHELGHALLGHQSYQSDISLLQKESAAWDRAIQVATDYGIAINSEHIQYCLDTYRDWLHKRSTCPDCGSHGLQQNKALYRCLNCQSTWKVSNDRFCRPYRLKKALAA